ncbi:MAG: hypothetical protein IJ215_00055 [Clostridia bacterium]|nr:hypothetical protein [Clostridia bacterium]
MIKEEMNPRDKMCIVLIVILSIIAFSILAVMFSAFWRFNVTEAYLRSDTFNLYDEFTVYDLITNGAEFTEEYEKYCIQNGLPIGEHAVEIRLNYCISEMQAGNLRPFKESLRQHHFIAKRPTTNKE